MITECTVRFNLVIKITEQSTQSWNRLCKTRPFCQEGQQFCFVLLEQNTMALFGCLCFQILKWDWSAITSLFSPWSGGLVLISLMLQPSLKTRCLGNGRLVLHIVRFGCESDMSKYYSLKILFFSAKDVPAEISFLRYIYLFICSILCLFPENRHKLKLCAQTAQLSRSVTMFELSWGNRAWSAWRWLEEVSSGREGWDFFARHAQWKGRGLQ